MGTSSLNGASRLAGAEQISTVPPMFNELGVAGSPRLPDFWAAMREASTGARYHRSFAATSWGVADRMEGHPNAFSKQTNCFSSPLARETWSVLDRRKPPRKCRLKECSPGETRYTLICLGEMAPVWTAEERQDRQSETDSEPSRAQQRMDRQRSRSVRPHRKDA